MCKICGTFDKNSLFRKQSKIAFGVYGFWMFSIIFEQNRPSPEVIKLFGNSAEHEILNAYKYKSIKKFTFFLGKISLECYFACS